ncbi:MAG: CheR family methyltransferase [Chloroflexota bacterium]
MNSRSASPSVPEPGAQPAPARLPGPLPGAVRFRLSEHDFQRFSALLLERFGLAFPDSRQAELEYRVGMAYAASTCATLDEFYAHLSGPSANAFDMDSLVNAVTVGETHFFRDEAQVDALYTYVLPALIERKRAQRVLRIWSAGCASGEEPYSLAMLLRELLPDIDAWSVTILGTDINPSALERARQGIYSEWAFREARARRLRPVYFQKTGERYLLDARVRRMVSFDRLNLVDAVYPLAATNTAAMDLILCRNVTIYFDPLVTRQVVDRFYDALVDDGWLAVGHSEPSLDVYRRFQARNFPNTLLYQRGGLPVEPGWAVPAAPLPPQPARRSPAAALAAPPPAPPPAPPSTPPAAPPAELAGSSLLDQARELLEYGEAQQAQERVERWLAGHPGDSAACALMGQIYANLAAWAQAETWCRRAVELDRLSSAAYYTLALVLQHQGRLDEAVEAMKKVVYLDRGSVLGHYGLANLYTDRGQRGPALKSLANVLLLLDGQPEGQPVPGAAGITAGRLRAAALSQQRAWSGG